ncbi:LacI family DNA-binding transcriptional regulator [Niabella aurantiaca]|uniref:LacI family DNA-binding transcriptional regulator n=1 Tax=Niabella aurantiaca TaxID=379900 RepID=UPI0003792D03|nr:LacI family DNA-binding transcriptional regulator [Niabella aurantiaca]
MNVQRSKEKRITIHDIAREIGIAPSSVSKALNNLPTISDRIKVLVRAKAKELNYVHNSGAANLRKGTSQLVGVVVPRINAAFFSDVIAGIEEKCFEYNHRLIICQSDETFVREVQAVETLIQQNVDCILISLSKETKTNLHLKEIVDRNIELIQFDRVDESFKSHIIVNDNEKVALKAVKHLLSQGYKQIAYFGGAEHIPAYKERKKGYLAALKSAGINIPYQHVVDDVSQKERAYITAIELLKGNNPPDAFFTVSDHAALGILSAIKELGLKTPEDVGIVGFANETFTEATCPTLTSIDQQSRKMGLMASDIFFKKFREKEKQPSLRKQETLVIKSTVVIRASSSRKK